jgi:hypothetical protein
MSLLCICHCCVYVTAVYMSLLCVCHCCVYVTAVCMSLLCVCHCCVYVTAVRVSLLCVCHCCVYVTAVRATPPPYIYPLLIFDVTFVEWQRSKDKAEALLSRFAVVTWLGLSDSCTWPGSKVQLYLSTWIVQVLWRWWRWVASFTLRRIYPPERTPVPIESKAVLGSLENTLIFCLCQESKEGTRAATPRLSHYTDWAIPALGCAELAEDSVQWNHSRAGWATISFAKRIGKCVNEAVVT